jgi:hypothetical protein
VGADGFASVTLSLRLERTGDRGILVKLVPLAARGGARRAGTTIPDALALEVVPAAPPGATAIRCVLPAGGAGGARLAVHGAGGRLVRVLPGPAAAGEQVLVWDGRDGRGRAAPAGVYFLRLEAPGAEVRTARTVLLP